MGPLVTKVHRDKVASYVDAGEREGATLVVDGRRSTPTARRTGSPRPDALRPRHPEMSVYTDEIFGPVLGVVRAGTYQEASTW